MVGVGKVIHSVFSTCLVMSFTVTIVATGCSDDTQSLPDAALGDVKVPQDVSNKDVPQKDASTSSDANYFKGCNQLCTQKGKNLCVKDPKTAKCVDCTKSEHCNRLEALGATCNSKQMCICLTTADCKNKIHGAQCIGEPGEEFCGCKSDADCKKPYICDRDFIVGYKVCKMGCKKDADCTKATASKCNPKTSRCVSCLSSADCGTNAPHCDASTHKCIQCSSDAHCATALRGKKCNASSGKCGCTADSHCTGKNHWGQACIPGNNICGCKDNANCAGNINGSTCSAAYRVCTCKSNGECASNAKRTECSLATSSVTFAHCQTPCSTTAQCKAIDSSFSKCSNKKCIFCETNGDCTFTFMLRTTCLTGLGACVECVKDAECGSGGAKCTANICKCSTGADCKGSPHGSVCNSHYQKCSCKISADCPSGKSCKGVYDPKMKFCK